MPSIFTRIIQGEIPCYKVAENEEFLAFLDINPLRAGHSLVIPKEEVDYIFDVKDELLSKMMVFAKSVALKMDKVLDCERIGVSVIGLEVPHAHIHLIPMNSVHDMNFAQPKLQLEPEVMKALAEEIASA